MLKWGREGAGGDRSLPVLPRQLARQSRPLASASRTRCRAESGGQPAGRPGAVPRRGAAAPDPLARHAEARIELAASGRVDHPVADSPGSAHPGRSPLADIPGRGPPVPVRRMQRATCRDPRRGGEATGASVRRPNAGRLSDVSGMRPHLLDRHSYERDLHAAGRCRARGGTIDPPSPVKTARGSRFLGTRARRLGRKVSPLRQVVQASEWSGFDAQRPHAPAPSRIQCLPAK